MTLYRWELEKEYLIGCDKVVRRGTQTLTVRFVKYIGGDSWTWPRTSNSTPWLIVEHSKPRSLVTCVTKVPLPFPPPSREGYASMWEKGGGGKGTPKRGSEVALWTWQKKIGNEDLKSKYPMYPDNKACIIFHTIEEKEKKKKVVSQ